MCSTPRQQQHSDQGTARHIQAQHAVTQHSAAQRSTVHRTAQPLHKELTHRAKQSSTMASTMPAMTAPAMPPDCKCVLLVVVALLSVVAVDSTAAVTVAFKSPVPTFPAKSWYVPAHALQMCLLAC